MTTQTEARDSIIDRINTAWLASATTQDLPLVFDDVDGEKPGYDEAGKAIAWGRVTVRHTAGAQETMAAPGDRRYGIRGNIVVQIFTPSGDGWTLSDSIVAILKTALRAPRLSHPVWYTDVTPAEIGHDGPWSLQTLSANFGYQERE